MITLITGTPGAGKTLYAVKLLVEELAPTGRQIYTNINGLDVPFENVHVCDDDAPYQWESFEDGTVFIFDEVQRQYPPRHSTAKIPQYISGYQTHRHRGMDFYFVTQGPKLIDRQLHDLTERHIHLFRAFGLSRSTVREWGAVNLEPQPPQSNTNAMKKPFRFPKKLFKYYRSASMHTVKPQLPWRPLAFMAGALCVVGWSGFKFSDWWFDQPSTVQTVNAGAVVPLYRSCAFRVAGYVGRYVMLVSGGPVMLVERSSITIDGAKVRFLDRSGRESSCNVTNASL